MTDEVLKALLDAMREENAVGRRENAAAHSETRSRIEALEKATRSRIDAMATENAAAHSERRGHFDAVAERLESRIELLAEVLQVVNEKVDTKTAMLDKKIDQTAIETQALVKFLYDDLGRRVLTLEQRIK